MWTLGVQSVLFTCTNRKPSCLNRIESVRPVSRTRVHFAGLRVKNVQSQQLRLKGRLRTQQATVRCAADTNVTLSNGSSDDGQTHLFLFGLGKWTSHFACFFAPTRLLCYPCLLRLHVRTLEGSLSFNVCEEVTPFPRQSTVSPPSSSTSTSWYSTSLSKHGANTHGLHFVCMCSGGYTARGLTRTLLKYGWYVFRSYGGDRVNKHFEKINKT
jgi:hypothetical protein